MREKLLNFANRLKSETQSLKEWQRNKPHTPLSDKLKKILTVFSVVILVLTWILSFPSSAAELPADNQRITHDGGLIPTDLTGYTVTVPSGWSATAGFGTFDVSGTVNYYDFSYAFSSFYVGYAINFDDGSLVNSSNAVVFYGFFETYLNDNSLSFTVSGGSDSSNSSLIQWFVDNNATFTPSSSPPSDTTVTFESGFYDLSSSWYTADYDFIASLDGFEFYTLGDMVVHAWDIIDNKLYAYVDGEAGSYLVAEVVDGNQVKWYDNSFRMLWKIYDDEVSSSFLGEVNEKFYVRTEDVPSLDAYRYLQDSYNLGLLDGFSVGYDTGYSRGFEEGVGISPEEGDTFLGNIVANILDALDKFTIVGSFSFLDLIKVLVGAFVLLFFLKLLAGG